MSFRIQGLTHATLMRQLRFREQRLAVQIPEQRAGRAAGGLDPEAGKRAAPNLQRPPHRAAVNRDRGAVDVAGERGGQERYEMADVVGLAKIAGGNVLLDIVGPRLLGRMQFLDLRRVDASRCDRVDRDPVRAELGRQRP
jgi:hypothetical protein